MEKNLTSGSVLKSILFFSLPYLLSYFLQTLYGMASIFRGLGDSRSPMYFIAAGLCLASLAVVNEKEYILVTLGAPGNHATEQTNIMDAVQMYRRLEKKK